ncbi:hypothetical protein FJQ98_05320 [Lysinibacillus agricola]|uniref:Uncharacterized protein n=1 Tax=Lysinibacillus agricola TaxID=2590012 RepID=A0ABX7AU37_9BACI|nr:MULTISPECIES: hypothetical protein [Lysinibacillus]QQP13485.1 hypothetical protein FJQ98_05320 [Lysinibacillus agricola]
MGISNRGTKALIGRPQEALLCAKAKRQQQQQMFSVAKAKRQLQLFYLCESEASATKRSVETEINPSFCRRAYYI